MDDLNTIQIRLRMPIFSKVYFNTPGDNSIIYNYKLIKLIEEIGRKYGNIKGSNLKKGIHYIYTNTNADSKREIKMMLRNVPNAIIKNEHECLYVFRCSIKHFVEIFEFIIKASGIDYGNKNLAETFIKPQMVGFRYVAANGTTEETINTANYFVKKLSEYK